MTSISNKIHRIQGDVVICHIPFEDITTNFERMDEQMPYFYEKETPVRVEDEGGIFEYYPEAKRFTVSRPWWTDAQGEKCRGKTVTLPVDKFKNQYQQLIELLDAVIGELQNIGGEK